MWQTLMDSCHTMGGGLIQRQTTLVKEGEWIGLFTSLEEENLTWCF
jgi:hypothetical protein